MFKLYDCSITQLLLESVNYSITIIFFFKHEFYQTSSSINIALFIAL